MRITITGPRSVGKSTVSKIVAKKLKLKWYSSDEIGEKALKKEGGLDKAIKSGTIGKFIKSSAYSLIREVYKKDDFVFDLSGGSVTSEKYPEASSKVREIAKKKSIIFGLLPYKNFNQSVNVLFEREKERIHFKEMPSKELFEKTKENYARFPKLFKNFCDFIVYVKDNSPVQIANEIIDKV